jgi:putative methionine-R-sulfoxide reductase with GAF domain
MTGTDQEPDFRRFYAHSFNRHIVLAMTIGVGVLLATGLLDWLFQPDRAPRIWSSRWILMLPMLVLTVLSARVRVGRWQQPIVVMFTLLGVGALLEFARLSEAPYHHYYNTGLVLMVMFCFVLTRIQFNWALFCSVLLFLISNIFWVGISAETVDLIVIKNFILAVTCLFSLMAAWTVEITFRRQFETQKTLESERDELSRMQAEQAEQTWLQERLARFQLEISGDRTVQDLFDITMAFIGQTLEPGFAAAYATRDDCLQRLASRGVPRDRALTLNPGEGLAGEAARHDRLTLINDVPADYTRIISATGDMIPAQLVFCPIREQGKIHGVIELAMIEPVSSAERQLLEHLGARLASALVVAHARHGGRLTEAADA